MRTVANANRIVVLDGGTVAENGAPEELLAMNGIFARMVEKQAVIINLTDTK
jgi:ATP-binding cassette subfamily B protein